MILKKPIIFFDLETTGVDVSKDRIVEIACVKILPDVEEAQTYTQLINPEIKIPEEAIAVHGITNQMVESMPTFKQISESLLSFFEGCDIGGYNSDEYDIPLLVNEFARSGLYFGSWEINTIDVLKIERKLHSNKLSDVYKRYTGNVLENSHSALADILATIEILNHQFPNSTFNAEEIERFYRPNRKYDLCGKLYLNNENKVCWAVGKNINKPIEQDMDYLKWVLKSDSFSIETKSKIKQYILNQLKLDL